MTSPTPTETALQSLRTFIQGQLGTYHDDVSQIAQQITSEKAEWDGKLAEFELQAQTIKDGTSELITKANRVDEFDERISGKADRAHTHTSMGVIDASPLVVPSVIAIRDSDGLFEVGSPARGNHPTPRSYVDSALEGKSNSGHNHFSSDISDRTSWVNHPDYPSKVVSTQPDGFLHGDNPVSDAHLAPKGYVDEEVGKKANTNHTHVISGVTGLQQALDNKSDSSHTHNSNDISNATTLVNALAANGGLILKTSDDGQLSITTSSVTKEQHATSKGYVDSAVSGKANTSHTHTISHVTSLQSRLDEKADTVHTHSVSQINDLPTISSALGNNRIVQRDGSGHILVHEVPGANNHAVSRSFVQLEDNKRVSKAGATQVLWLGTEGEFETLPENVKNDSGFIGIIQAGA